MSEFIFRQYDYTPETGVASFHYAFAHGRSFTETITFTPQADYDEVALNKALFLCFLIIGISYYKTAPTPIVSFASGAIDAWQADFLNNVYGEGLSQFAFENNLTRADLAQFSATTDQHQQPASYSGKCIVALQSGGKDSLLVASLLETEGREYTPWYLGSSTHHPNVLEALGQPLLSAERTIDHEALRAAQAAGGKNGHVPVTYIVQSIALVQAILLGKNEVLVSIAHEGEEPHAMIGDLPVTHQWSKTWGAEQLFAEYVTRYISTDVYIGSPLRQHSELRVAELFVEHAWDTFGHRFSSCNRANYRQGADNSELKWCGECPKCANSYLLFAPFVAADELQSLFAGQDLFTKPLLQETFRGLLGIDGVMKPFECVGEIEELRYAYHQSQAKEGYGSVSFDVPAASFDYKQTYPSQDWAQLPR